ncbi:MAG TPA: hypothetical protein VJU18_11165 [Vicinamibacteria bacterium]|nr:hypothetical protein [Vicinamibacteria bacterium]
MPAELKAPIRVSLDRLFLDPNNPRLAATEKPGYADPNKLFDDDIQIQLEIRMRRSYKGIKGLMGSILGMGWIPVDAMLVWEHPKAKGHYVVVEGNARTTALRMIRREHQRELNRLAKAKTRPVVDPATIEELEATVRQYEQVLEDTREIEVAPVAASAPSDLSRSLPRLLGVRHISHAQQWKPYATNLYVYSLYRQLFEDSHGHTRLQLEDDLLRKTGSLVTMTHYKVRRAVQVVVAFNRFKARFEDRLPEGERFRDQDQSYFLAILEPGYAREQFAFRDADLTLAPDLEDVLFQWAFARPRGSEPEENPNILRSADDIRTWARLARYDEKMKTGFAKRLDVNRPERARPMAKVEAEYLSHKAQRSPLDTLEGLLEALKTMEVETLRAGRAQIKPAIRELLTICNDYLAILEAID